MVDSMILPVWMTLIALGALFTIVAFVFPTARGLFFHVLAGITWFVVGFESGSLHALIVYDTTNALKEFHYPVLILFFTLLAAFHLLYTVYSVWMILADESRTLSSEVGIKPGADHLNFPPYR